MKEGFLRCLLLLIVIGGDVALAQEIGDQLELPSYSPHGGLSLNTALAQRRSSRDFRAGQLPLKDISQILWSAQGINHPDGLRTTPSAGALYPLEIYLAAGHIEGLQAGVYRYQPKEHALVLIRPEDPREKLTSAALNQAWVGSAPAVLIIAGVYQRTTAKYAQRGHRYVHIEVGHAAQNVYLQAAALDLASVFVGAFDDSEVQRVLGLPGDHAPLALMSIGTKP